MPERTAYRKGQVVWHDPYKRYLKIVGVVMDSNDRPHSYIVPAWNTKGTIQVFAENMRPLTAEETAGALTVERDERAAFEEWASLQPDLYPGKRMRHYYTHPETQIAWDAWQARASQPDDRTQEAHGLLRAIVDSALTDSDHCSICLAANHGDHRHSEGCVILLAEQFLKRAQPSDRNTQSLCRESQPTKEPK